MRINGTVSKIPQAQSQAYFSTRPRASQLGALASQQSRVVADRQVLEQRFVELEQRYQESRHPYAAGLGRLSAVAPQ